MTLKVNYNDYWFMYSKVLYSKKETQNSVGIYPNYINCQGKLNISQISPDT